MSKKEFIELVTADQPEAPPYFTYDAVLNSKERPTLEETLGRQLKPLELDRVRELQAGGDQVLDTREPEEFATAHLAGSINIGLSGQYATWAGTVLSRERSIVIIANPGRESESAIRLGRIGFDNLVGYLSDGMRSLELRPDVTVKTERLSAALCAELLASGEPPLLVDVRAPREREQRFIDGSVSMPLNHLPQRAEELPKDRELLVYCAGGYRSSIAASLLQQKGFDRVSEMAGGIAAWDAAKLRVHTGQGPAIRT
jgi:rhodanese-related sulfurtransferase